MRKTRRKRAQRGFTLIELMISLVLFSFAIAGVLAVAVSMAQGYREQRLIIQTEGAARGALDYISDALRMASPAVNNPDVTTSTSAPAAGDPHLIIGDIEDTESTSTNCQRGSIRVYNNTGAPDELQIVFASGATVTSLDGAWVAGATTVTVTDASNLAVGDRILITDSTNGHIVKITNIATNTLTVAAAACTLASTPTYNTGLVLRVLRAHFYVGTFDGVPDVLLMDPDGDGAATPEPLADSVEDFQVAAGIDENANDAIDATEWAFSGVSGTPATFTLTMNLRAIRVTIIARATNALGGATATFLRPAVEDRAAASTYDKFRRRVLSSTVDIRNLKDSP